MPKKQVLIIIAVLAVSAFALPFLSNSDLFKGSLIISSGDDVECIDLGSGRQVYLATAEVNRNQIPVYKDADNGECDAE